MYAFARSSAPVLVLALVLAACGGSGGSGGSEGPPGTTEPAQPFSSDAYTVFLWHLDQGSGQLAFDTSVNNAHLQLGETGVTDAMDPDWSETGHIGPCLAFAAAEDDYATWGMPSVFQTNAFTVELWFRATSPEGRLFEAGPEVFVLGWDAGQLHFRIHDGSADHAATITDPTELAALTDGSWHYVAGTYDGATMRVYVDGVEKASTTTNPIPPSVTALYLGGHPGGGQSIAGEIDEVRISSTARSPSEIEAHWNAANP